MNTRLPRLATAVLLALAQALHAASVVEFRVAEAEFFETPTFDGFPGYSIGITLTPLPQTAGKVAVRVVGGTAKQGEDFQIAPSANFLKSQGETWVGFEAIDDGIPEPDETIQLELEILESDAVVGDRSRMTVTIHNRPSQVTIAGTEFSSSLTVPEGPATMLEFRRAGDRDKPTVVEVEFSNGHSLFEGIPPIPASRFVPSTNRIEFRPGEASLFLPLPLLDNGAVDGPFQIFNPAPYFAFQARLVSRTAGLSPNIDHEVNVMVVDNELRADEDVSGTTSDPFILFEPKSDVRFIPIPNGWKLAIGSFARVNGVPRPGLCRLTADDELDESFTPPLDLNVVDGLWSWGFTLGGTARFARFGSPVLVERAGSILIKSPRFMRILEDGRIDPSFRPPFESGVAHLAEATDGTLWTTKGNVVYHLAGDGTLLHSTTLKLAEDQIVAVQNDGKVLIRVEVAWDPERDELGHLLVRVSNEGNPDTSFSPIRLDGDAGILPDDRLIASSDGGIRLFVPNGMPDLSFRPVLFDWPFNGIGSSGVALNMDQLWVRPIGHSDDFPATRFHFDQAPRTALKLVAWRSIEESLAGQLPSSAYAVTFRRLGSSAAPAAVHFTTRDLTATAGKDYMAQSGTITFAPLETEKTIHIPILTDSEDELVETLEIVVTGGEGFEALPAPMRLTISEWNSPGFAPTVEHIKRLRDGRVLLGGPGPQHTTRLEYSTDLNTWHPLTNLLGGFNGPSAVWLDASATNAATRYYRAVAP